MMVSPITGEMIPADKMEEHMRYSEFWGVLCIQVLLCIKYVVCTYMRFRYVLCMQVLLHIKEHGIVYSVAIHVSLLPTYACIWGCVFHTPVVLMCPLYTGRIVYPVSQLS